MQLFSWKKLIAETRLLFRVVSLSFYYIHALSESIILCITWTLDTHDLRFVNCLADNQWTFRFDEGKVFAVWGTLKFLNRWVGIFCSVLISCYYFHKIGGSAIYGLFIENDKQEGELCNNLECVWNFKLGFICQNKLFWVHTLESKGMRAI